MKSVNRAFTLIELLVVIAIIAILAAILFPVFAQAGAAAQAKKIMAASSHTQNLLPPADYRAKVADLAMSPGAKKQSNRQ